MEELESEETKEFEFKLLSKIKLSLLRKLTFPKIGFPIPTDAHRQDLLALGGKDLFGLRPLRLLPLFFSRSKRILHVIVPGGLQTLLSS